ncbi:MAG: hypothetical protein F7B60_05110 [Desulfurococcales archaeon]|nr:hypothetical protein [Desulfurococcales archaeon]
MLIEAEVKIDESNRDFNRIVCNSLAPEIKEEEKMARGKIMLKCDQPIIVGIKTSKIGELQALLSSYLGLLKIILDVYRANL